MNSDMILADIMEQWNIEDNFRFCFSKYIDYLEREGRWKLCPDNRTKNNFKYRMRQVQKGKIDPTKEWNKFENWVEKMKVSEQKDVERRAIKLDQQWKVKYEQEKNKNIELQKEIELWKKTCLDKDASREFLWEEVEKLEEQIEKLEEKLKEKQEYIKKLCKMKKSDRPEIVEY